MSLATIQTDTVPQAMIIQRYVSQTLTLAAMLFIWVGLIGKETHRPGIWPLGKPKSEDKAQ